MGVSFFSWLYIKLPEFEKKLHHGIVLLKKWLYSSKSKLNIFSVYNSHFMRLIFRWTEMGSKNRNIDWVKVCWPERSLKVSKGNLNISRGQSTKIL